VRFYFVQVRVLISACTRVSEASLASQVAKKWVTITCEDENCMGRWTGMGRDLTGAHDRRELEVWRSHCGWRHGRVVSFYDTIGKARSTATRYRKVMAEQDRRRVGHITDVRVAYFMEEMLLLADDPAPLHEQLESSAVRVMQRAAAAELDDRDALAASTKRGRRAKAG
jgi:hypothetical protein